MRLCDSAIPRLVRSVLTAALVIPSTLLAAAAGHAQTPAQRPPVPGAPAGVLAFVNVGVVPMDQERVLTDQTVLIKNGWITALGPATKVKVPAGAVRIDGRGHFLMPGLADMHAHLKVWRDGQAEVERVLLTYVASGVTTVRNMEYYAAKVGPPVLALRARAAAGELVSPRIYTSGLWGQPKDGSGGDNRDQRSATKPEAVAAEVAAYKAAGYDHLKSREDIDPTTAQGRALFDSLVAAAQRVGLPIVGHVANEPGWFEHNPAALKSIEHLTAYLPEFKADPPDYAAFYAKLPARVALTQAAGVWNCPTLWLLESAAGPLATDTQATKGGNEAYRRRVIDHLTAYRRVVKALQEAGTGLLLGTDINKAPRVNEAINWELQALVRAGLTPYQALATGTTNVAAYYGTRDSSGTVAVGKRADLVLLPGNPLEDIRHVRSPAGVLLGGRWLPRAELERQLALAPGTTPSATP